MARKCNNVQEYMTLLSKMTGQNDVVDDCNSRLNKQINRPRLTFLALYKCFELEAEHGSLLYNQHFLHLEGKKRKKMLHGARQQN